jgi:hypothetical protein
MLRASSFQTTTTGLYAVTIQASFEACMSAIIFP